MDCLNCGACCKFTLLHHPFSLSELEELREIKKIGDVAFLPTPCKYFNQETKKCEIYENRPTACMNFCPGGLTCLLCRKAAGIK